MRDAGNARTDPMQVLGEAASPHWYLIQSKPRQTLRAREHLENQGFNCFLPEIDAQARQGTRCVTRREPLFPGYLFIRLSAVADNWLPIRSTRGVQRLVTFADHPLPVGDNIVDAIRARVEQPSASHLMFEPGERVRIVDGPFANVEAIFDCFSGQERVLLLLSILHKPQRLSFPLQNIARQV